MKYRDIERMASDAVRDYMDDGWVLNYAVSAQPGVYFLDRDGERIAMGIRTVYYDEKHARGWSRSLDAVDVVLMFISRASEGSFDWLDRPENVIYEKVLFKVNGDWYVEDESVAVEARAKVIERERGALAPERTFHPTKAFLDKWVRGRCGWKNVKPCDVVITRQKCAQGIYYSVRKTVGKDDWFTVTSLGKR